MKNILTMMLLMVPSVALAQISTDTLKDVQPKVVELHITRPAPVQATSKKTKTGVLDLGNHAVCSGAFVTSSGDILTARHCATDIESIDVVTADGREYEAKVVAISSRHDLALIHIDELNTPYFRLATTLAQGQTIYTYGSPLAITGTLATGIVAKLNGDVNYIDCSVLPGNSGGPLFNDAGELVGITTAGFVVLFGMTHLNIAQSIAAIIFFGLSIGGR